MMAWTTLFWVLLNPTGCQNKHLSLRDINGDGRKDIGAPGIIRNNQRSTSGGAYIIFR